MTLRHVDLFAGTGAFTHAFQSTGKVRCVFANDFSEHSRTIYESNFGKDRHFVLGDLCEVANKIPEHDILTAGFPCQPFSIAGKREGFKDVRSNVFWKILEIIDAHRPMFVLLENVKNLKTHDNGNTFKIITDSLLERGYWIEFNVLDTCTVTHVPQHRERIYIIASLVKPKSSILSPPSSSMYTKSITSLLETRDIPEKYYYKTEWSKSITKENTVYQYRRVYVRENKRGVCPTLTANMGSGGHNVPLIIDPRTKRVRKLTPRECFNLQGFPNTYILPSDMADSHLYKLAGNAVSLPVIEIIAQKILENVPS